jgi:hypothetical protein
VEYPSVSTIVPTVTLPLKLFISSRVVFILIKDTDIPVYYSS